VSWEMPEMNSIEDHARMMHELYTSTIEVGFTPHQAMHIILNNPCCTMESE
jgi:hypothetical protein